ncbi:hypothetical protein GW17_00015820 [Ensete ventricosum]|nr:hypothetical protein GW17_00015820 [Ensete ventricosum]
MMRLKTRQECIESLSRVSGAYQNGARKFARRRPRLSGVAEKLVGSWDGLVMDFPVGKPPVSNGKTVVAQVSGRLTAGKPPVP